MYYPAVISAVLFAVTAAPALAAPSGLGLRAFEEDALAQRSFDNELYARDLIFRRAGERAKRPAPPRPPRRQNALRPLQPPPGSKRPGQQWLPEKSPVHDPQELRPGPKLRALDDSDEYLLARAIEEDELFARAWEDAVFARLDVDDLN